MANAKGKDKVREGFFTDLPEDIQKKIIVANKIISDEVNDILKNNFHYQDLLESRWAMSCLDEFHIRCSSEGEIGSVRVVKSGSKYKCSIQVTGKFRNHQYGWIEELVHEFLMDVWQCAKSTIRKKCNLTLVNEGKKGSSDEYFSITLTGKPASEMWDRLEDRTTMTVSESVEIDDFEEFAIFPGSKLKKRYKVLKSEINDAITPAMTQPMKNIHEDLAKYCKSNGIDIDFCAPDSTTGNYFDTYRTRKHWWPEGWGMQDVSTGAYTDAGTIGDTSENEKKLLSGIIDIIKRHLPFDIVAPEFTYFDEGWYDFAFNAISDDVVVELCGGSISDVMKEFREICDEMVAKDIKPAFEESAESDLAEYYENYSSLMSYDDYFQERSHGKLQSSFRTAMNIANGHYVKIVFDLNPSNVDQIGDHTRQHLRDFNKDREIAKNIAKTGNNDFSSKATVKAIVDMDTNQRLDTVKAVGVVGAGNADRIKVPEKYRDSRLGEDASRFQNYPVKIRERIISEVKPSFPDAITYTVGKMEPVPSYKATVIPKSLTNLYSNQFNARGRGIQSSRVREDSMNIRKAVQLVENQFAKLKPVIATESDDDDIAFFVKSYQRNLTKIKSVIADNKGDQYGQTTADTRYSSYYKRMTSAISEIKSILREKGKPINEAAVHQDASLPSSNGDMTVAQAKKTLAQVTSTIISDSEKEGYKVSQYTANIYANVITKNLLSSWCDGYKKLSITLESNSNQVLEFKIPNMSQDFVSRFINGREPINAFLHRVPEIKIKMDPKIFSTMKDPNDAYNFFRAAVKYYDFKVEKYCKSISAELMRMGHSLKQLVSTTKLSGLVTYPLQMLFVFDKVDMANAHTFELSAEDIAAVNKFIRSIPSAYAAPEKEKKQIIDDVKSLVRELRESCAYDDNMRDISYLPEAVETLFSGTMNSTIYRLQAEFEKSQVDFESMKMDRDHEAVILMEKFGVKKLKRIPNDLVAYIQVETEAIETPNDKMMIASYCLSKIEIVEWYIELLEVGSKKYVVPHSKPYLEGIRTQLLVCYKKIMDTKVSPKKNKPLISIDYPSGYEG